MLGGDDDLWRAVFDIHRLDLGGKIVSEGEARSQVPHRLLNELRHVLKELGDLFACVGLDDAGGIEQPRDCKFCHYWIALMKSQKSKVITIHKRPHSQS